MRKFMLVIAALGVALVAGSSLAGIATALPEQPRAVGGIEYSGGSWLPPGASVKLSFVAAGTPTDASGRVQFRRSMTGFDANSAGPVTCYLQVGNQAYFSGTFDRPFLSGPTEITFFYATVVDGDPTGDVDKAIVFITAGQAVPCDEEGTMSFLDSQVTSNPVSQGQIQVLGTP